MPKIKKYQTDGEHLIEEIRVAMVRADLNITTLSRKSKISRAAIYRYFENPGSTPLKSLMKLAYAAGLREITLRTGGCYL